MNKESVPEVGAPRRRFPGRIMMGTAVALFAVILYRGEAAPFGIAPEVEKKAVSLNTENGAAEHLFCSRCGECHKAPDAAVTKPAPAECTSGLAKNDLAKVGDYLSSVRAGKAIYESNCDRCHTLIEPSAHTFDYWSKNICTSDSCMVKRRLTADEEQQLLLYLSSRAKKSCCCHHEKGEGNCHG